jgi:hypothetical protein
MTPITLLLSSPVPARSTARYIVALLDEGGSAIALSALQSLALTLVDTASGAIIEGVSQVDILNTGRGSVSAGGVLTLILLPADTALYGRFAAGRQKRSIVLDWRFVDAATGQLATGRHEARFAIQALAEP